MGISSSSLLDESKTNFIRGRADAVLKDFSAYYKRQYLVAFFSKVQDEVEQKKMGQTQLLKQREHPKPAEVLYEENVLFFDDTRKWKERVVVVRANYSLECHDSYETFVKGVQSRHKLLPTGGTALTSEEQYMVLVDKLCPDLNNAKEEFAPPMATMPGQFPVYLRLPYRRDSYFCFRQEARRTQFLSVLTDCIRHQNQDFLRKSACEVEAFRKALRFYRQEKGLYDSWDMLIGSDVRVLANMVMEELLPTLQTELLPRLKGKKTDRKKAWFATVEAAYILVQEQLLKGLLGLKQECRVTAKQQEARIRSDMDQIITSRDFLAGKLRAMVTEPAAKFCSEKVQPHLAPVLEELMGPVSMGFQETRTLCERQMSQLCQDLQESSSAEELKLALEQLRKTNLQGCYAHVDVLQDQLRELQSHYNFSNCTGLVHSTQIDMQQLMGNAAYTFEQLLHTALKDSPARPGSVMEKAKHRVLKQYDYDSSTMRKRIFQEALLDITLPAMKKNLAPTCKPELQAFDQYIFADYSNFIQVENVYEDILLQTLESEVSKVVNEAASLKRHNLFLDGTDMRLASQSSLSEGLTPPGSTPSSPSKTPQSQNADSPLLRNGQLVNPEQRDTSSVTERELVENAEKHVTTETVNGDARSSPEAEQENKPNTAEAEKESTASTDEGVHSVAEVEKEVTPSESQTEDLPGATEAEEDTPFAAELTDEDTIRTAEAEQEDVPSASEIPAETIAPAASPQTVEPLPSPSPDSAGEEHPDVDSMVDTSSNPPLAESGTGTESPSMLVIEQAEENDGSDAETAPTHPCSDAITDTGTPSTGCSKISVDSPEVDSDIGVMSAEDSEDGGTAGSSSEPTEEVTESDVSLTSDLRAEGTEGNPETLNVDHVSEATETEVCADATPTAELAEEGVVTLDVSLTSSPTSEVTESDPETVSVDPVSEATEIQECVDAVPNAEEAEEGVVTLGDEPVSEPTENSLPTAAVSPRVSSPAEAKPAEEPGQVKAQAPDCIKEIRSLVVEVIEVEEMVQHYPGGSSS
ncbi:hypothetical protein SKAU_G00067260 [Synaphobranchus kaupii]|uniref:Niban 1/2/3 domain-containing protein n=1 Tax=Synaphobranchus kaupii TaxID=118154 RepID=A0A9Q1G6Z4_SYNKA|nr:hypothetical protein SKAU_G00067260 [Synaphobranchus kaupii]